MEPKKPARDISNLKARLGIQKPGMGPGPAAPGGAPPPGASPIPQRPPTTGALPTMPASVPPGTGYPPAMTQPVPGVPAPMPPGVPVAPGGAPRQPPRHDPYASFRPAAGTRLDLGPDDGVPAENVRQRGGRAGLVINLILLAIGLGVGGGFGGAAIGRKAYNNTNAAAKLIKAELDVISKNVSQIGDALKLSAQRSVAAGDPFAFDYKLVEDLEQLDLSKRPTTTRIFKPDYSRLDDNLLDRLMTYYYDANALYREAEEHVRKTKNERTAIESYAKKATEKKSGVNYGIVFDNTGNLMIGNLVEVGAPVCSGGGSECPASEISGFQVRTSPSAAWSTRGVGPKLDPKNVIPIKPTALFDAVMTGSPEQVMMESYRQRIATLRILETRLSQTQKELVEAVNKAAARPNLWTPF